MKRKIFSILFALVLLASFSLVTAVPATAEPGEAEGELVGSYSYSWTTSIMDSTDFDFTVGMGWSGPFPWPPNVYFFFHPDEIPLGGYTEPIGGAWLFENIDFDETAAGETFSVTSVADDPDFAGFASLLTNGIDEVIWLGYMGDRDDIASAGGQKSLPELGPSTDVPGWTIESVSLTFNQIYLDPENVNKLVLDFTLDIYAFPPTEVWVAPTGDDSDPGTEASPFATIQKGIDTVAPDGTVNVLVGNYTENVDVNKQVTIIGVGEANTIVTAADDHDNVFEVTANGVNISGFTVQGVGQYANYKAGIYLGGVDNCIISGNTATENYNGIRLEDSDGNTITENTCNENYQSGIHLKGSLDNTITDNDCLSNSASGIVLEEWSDGNTIEENNTFTLNNMDGIYLSKSSYNTITDNDCSSNGDYGIFLTGMGSDESSYNTIKRNTCNSNGPGFFGGAGIYLMSYASYNTIEENTINTNIGCGIQLHAIQTIDNVIHFNDIVGNTEYGVKNWATDEVDATNNWWGDATGPDDDAEVINGSGDKISTNVDAQPWYATATTREHVYVTVKVGETDEVRAYSDTIQGGIDAACPNDTVNVAKGIYDEDVNINKSLQLLGAKAGVPAGPDANPANRGGDEESIINGTIEQSRGISGSTIDGFTILSNGQHGILLPSTERVGDVIKNNIIDGGSGNIESAGISSGRGGGYLITNNNIRNYLRGMLFDGWDTDPQCTISGNYITNCSMVGIATMGSWSNGHIFSNNLIENNGCGITLAQGEYQVSGNTIRNNSGSGILLWGTPRTSGIQITQNTIEGNVAGIKLWPDDPGAVNNVAHFNNIVGNGDGVINNHSAEFDATMNWWGDNTGPEQVATNPDGEGNAVSDNVGYMPWLTRNFRTVLDEGIGYYGFAMAYLETGWNILSTPFALDEACDTWGDFADFNGLVLYDGGDPQYVNAYYFDGEAKAWGSVDTSYPLTPCDAIYVRMAEPDIAALLASPKRSVPTKTLYKGWNLVGLSWMPTEWEYALQADFALKSVELVGSLVGYTQVVSPWMNQDPWTFVAGMTPSVWENPENTPPPAGYMEFTKGYWVFMENGPDDLAGSWFTPMGLP